MDFTGCGNTLRTCSIRAVLQLIMDSLRYWVDRDARRRLSLRSRQHPGPRAATKSNKLGAFFDIIHQDPVLSKVKLIAEPWDLGPGGYQVGNFPCLDGMERQIPRLGAPLLER